MRSKNGDHISAIEDFDNAIRIDPKKDYLFNSRGFSKAQTGDYIGAIKDFLLHYPLTQITKLHIPVELIIKHK